MRSLALLTVAVVLGGLSAACATGRSTTEAGAGKTTTAIADAVKLIRANRLDEAEKLLSDERAAVASSADQAEQIDYYLATVLVYRDKLDDAIRLVDAHAIVAAQRGDADSEVWLDSSLAWLLWAKGEHAHGVHAVEAGAGAIGKLNPESRRAWAGRLLWQRAFFLLELAYDAPAEQRAELLTQSDAAFRELLTGASRPEDAGPRTALSALGLLRKGDLDAARQTALTVKVDQEIEPSTAYVLATVLEATGEKAKAADARAHASARVSLLTPIFSRLR